MKKLEAQTGMKTGLSSILPQCDLSIEPGSCSSSEIDSSTLQLPFSRLSVVSPIKYLPLSLQEMKMRSERKKNDCWIQLMIANK